MENEKLRHVVFFVICAVCLMYMLQNSSSKQKKAAEEKAKKEKVDAIAGGDSDKKKSEEKIPGEDKVDEKTSVNDKADGPIKKEDGADEVKPAPKEIPVIKKTYAVADTPKVEFEKINIDTKEFKFIFSSQGGTLVNLNLHNYRSTFKKDSSDYQLVTRKKAKWNRMLSVQGFGNVFNKAHFVMDLEKKSNSSILTMVCIRDGIEVVKTVEVKETGFDFQFKIKITNHRKKEIENDLTFIGITDMYFDLEDRNSIMSDQIATLINDDGDLISAGDWSWFGRYTYGARQGIHDLTKTPFVMGKYRKTKRGKKDGAKVIWGALKNRYFAIIFKPTKDDWTVRGSDAYAVSETKPDKNEKKETKHLIPLLAWQSSGGNLIPGESFEGSFKVYAGPTKNGVINLPEYEKDKFVDVIDYGFLFPKFLKLFDRLLNFIISIVGENQYWLGIILLTLMVRMGMFPITRKSSMSQAKLQKVTPRLKEIREKFKGDNRKIQEETMKLYRAEGVNPFSSCLPMFLQMPIFLGLYWTFMLTFEVRFKPFLWINDLAVADHLWEHGLEIVFLGVWLNLLPLLYSVINYFHMSSMPAPQDPMQAQQQKIMRYIFPVMMLMFFYQMPSALVLYFIVSGTWSIVEQKLIKAKIKKLEGVPAK